MFVADNELYKIGFFYYVAGVASVLYSYNNNNNIIYIYMFPEVTLQALPATIVFSR